MCTRQLTADHRQLTLQSFDLASQRFCLHTRFPAQHKMQRYNFLSTLNNHKMPAPHLVANDSFTVNIKHFSK
jgi:hypothetical protein